MTHSLMSRCAVAYPVPKIPVTVSFLLARDSDFQYRVWSWDNTVMTGPVFWLKAMWWTV